MTQFPLTPLPDRPLVSIIIPSFNQGRFIRETIESCLSQDYRPIEILVVDGASTDGTLDVLRQYAGRAEVAWSSEPDSGVVEAVNKGFARARGAVGAIQSSDDYYLPGAIRQAVEALKSDRSLGFVFGDIIKADAAGRELQRTALAPFGLEDWLSVRTWIPQPSTFFRMDLAKVLGGWRPHVPYAADADLWLRMVFRAGARKLDALLAVRRMHDAQRDTRRREIIRDYARMIDESEELRGAPQRVRRAAAAGKHVMRCRYNPTGSDVYGAWNLLMAGCVYPPCLNPRAILLGILYFPVRRRLARLKHALLRARRVEES